MAYSRAARQVSALSDAQIRARPLTAPCAPRHRTVTRTAHEEHAMPIGTILLIILILILVGALPSWPYSRGWGYYPSGIVGIIVVVLIVLLLMGRL